MLFKYDTQIYANTQNWKKYVAVTLSKTDELASKDVNQLVEIASVYLNYIKDPVALEKAITWIEKAIVISENAEKHLVAAKLYLKIKNKTKALEEAEKAKQWSANMGWSTVDSEKIIQEIKASK
jgi:tetratricopeptide (TPR) repeat protein